MKGHDWLICAVQGWAELNRYVGIKFGVRLHP